MKRSYLKRGTTEMKRTPMSSRTERVRVPGTARKATRLKAGPRTKAWARVWAFLKPQLEKREITRCEFWFITHTCSDILTPAHSKKRNKMQGNAIYEVALACTTIHQILDEKFSHEEMYEAVMRAINNRGGIILPAKLAA